QMQRAMHLLGQSDLPIGQVARRSGYRDQRYFSKVFRQEADQSPSEYRKANAPPAKEAAVDLEP
ncbi:MAG: helix-turn-helix domain-containing protein, partial [Phycisphaerae bacterium]